MKLSKNDLNHVFRHIKPTYTHISANDQLLPYIVIDPIGVAIPSQAMLLGRELDGILCEGLIYKSATRAEITLPTDQCNHLGLIILTALSSNSGVGVVSSRHNSGVEGAYSIE